MKTLSRMLKSSRLLYDVYFFVMSALLRLLGLLVGSDDRLILFNSYGGKHYDDSPRAIYERMLSDARFRDYRLVWALQDPGHISVPGGGRVIRTDSLQYFVTALRARVWVTNSSMERGLDFKKRRTLCFNTWHGSAIKRMGTDIGRDNLSFRSRVLVRADLMCAQSRYDVDIFTRAFRLPASRFQMTGLPRNDRLAAVAQAQVDAIRARLGIESGRIVLLYAPTFREYARSTSNELVLDIPMDLRRWQETLGERFVVLFRAHYEVSRHMKADGFPLFRDVSDYPDLNDLMIASDALISDYSSIYIDYSIMHKPMYCFAYDYQEYMEKRGMYIDLRDELPCAIHRNEDSLIRQLLRFDDERAELSRKAEQFQRKYVEECGHGAEKCCDIIAGLLGSERNRRERDRDD